MSDQNTPKNGSALNHVTTAFKEWILDKANQVNDISIHELHLISETLSTVTDLEFSIGDRPIVNYEQYTVMDVILSLPSSSVFIVNLWLDAVDVAEYERLIETVFSQLNAAVGKKTIWERMDMKVPTEITIDSNNVITWSGNRAILGGALIYTSIPLHSDNGV